MNALSHGHPSDPRGPVCGGCGHPNEADARHCDQCGAALGLSLVPPSGAAPLGGRRAALIGAGEGSGLRLNDDRISSVHALLFGWGTGARVMDLGSTNGTTVQGATAATPGGLLVGHGGVISVGRTQVLGAHLFAALSRGSRALIVGRDPDCDLSLDLPVVSNLHLIALDTPEGLLVIDLGSSNGTQVKAAGSPLLLPLQGPTLIGEDDTLYLGTVRLPAPQLRRRLSEGRLTQGAAATPAAQASLPGQVVPLPAPGGSIVVGRDPGCDVVISSPQVSARHLRISPQADGGVVVEDLGSLNGTFFKGDAITRATLPPRASLTVGTHPIHLDGQRGTLTVGDRRGALRLDAVGVSRVVINRETKAPLSLVNDVSVSIYPSELVGLMGPSGAGKTTFMLALNGYEPPTSGQVQINGDDLYTHFDQYRGLIGYVPQDDIMHGELTVEEALRYAARLRLPPDTTEAEISAAVDRVLEELRLEPQRHVQIGSPEAKVLSGGQRKRVNLALELVTDPILLFLDEPTSGLSARDTRDVMEVLRSLADSGRTLVITIHQPSREVYERMDHVIHLARGGRLAFFGPTAPDSYDYFGLPSPSPEGILDRMEDQTPEAWQARYLASPARASYVGERQAKAPDREALRPEVERRSTPVPQLSQWWTLLSRYARIKVRDRTNLFFMIAQAPIVGLLLAVAFHDAAEDPLKRGTPIFILCIAVVFFGCMNACREIVTERAIFRRERMVNLKIAPYLMSKFVFLAGVGVFQSAILLAIARQWVGLDGEVSTYLALLSLASVAATGLGLWISSMVRSAEAAMAAVPILLVFQIVLSGFLIPLKAEGKEYIEALAAPMISRWAVEGLLDVERVGIPDALERELWEAQEMEVKDLRPGKVPQDGAVLLLFTVGYLTLAGWRLSRSGTS